MKFIVRLICLYFCSVIFMLICSTLCGQTVRNVHMHLVSIDILYGLVMCKYSEQIFSVRKMLSVLNVVASWQTGKVAEQSFKNFSSFYVFKLTRNKLF